MDALNNAHHYKMSSGHTYCVCEIFLMNSDISDIEHLEKWKGLSLFSSVSLPPNAGDII